MYQKFNSFNGDRAVVAYQCKKVSANKKYIMHKVYDTVWFLKDGLVFLGTTDAEYNYST